MSTTPYEHHIISAWRTDWIASGFKPYTHEIYRLQVLAFGRWLGGEKSLLDATRTDVQNYIIHRLTTLSAASAHASWRAMRGFYVFAQSVDDELPNPMRTVKAPKVPEPSVVGMEPADIKHLLQSMNGKTFRDVRDRCIVQLLTCTGLRCGELAALTVDAVSVESRSLIIRHSKTGKPRVVPMTGEATLTLVKYLRLRDRNSQWAWTKTPALWGSEKGPMIRMGVNQMLTRRATPLGLKVTPHMFRRAFAVAWLTQGGSQVSLQSICGWSSGAMATKYTRFAAGALADAEYRRLYA